MRCSRAERFFVRAHRIAPFARGRPSLEKRERVVRAAMGSKSFVHTTELKRDRQDMSDSVKILSGFSVANNNNNHLNKGRQEMQGDPRQHVTNTGLTRYNEDPPDPPKGVPHKYV